MRKKAATVEPAAVNPYAARGWSWMTEAWQRGYEGRPMLAYPGSAYERIYREGQAARTSAPKPS